MSIYRSKENFACLSENGIKEYLKSDVDIIIFDEIDSTNNEAKRRAPSFTGKDTLIVAKKQTSGRGRLGRSFYSPKDSGLYITLMLKPRFSLTDILCITAAASVSVTDAIISLTNTDPKIKWVNDIYLSDKKVCGILTELVCGLSSLVDCVIVGIGINLTTDNFPQDIKDIAGSIGKTNNNRLCAKITDNLINEYKHIQDRSFIKKYKERSCVLGNNINYIENGITKSAVAIDFDNNGGLIIQDGGVIKTLSSGEITLRIKKQRDVASGSGRQLLLI